MGVVKNQYTHFEVAIYHRNHILGCKKKITNKILRICVNFVARKPCGTRYPSVALLRNLLYV